MRKYQLKDQGNNLKSSINSLSAEGLSVQTTIVKVAELQDVWDTDNGKAMISKLVACENKLHSDYLSIDKMIKGMKGNNVTINVVFTEKTEPLDSNK